MARTVSKMNRTLRDYSYVRLARLFVPVATICTLSAIIVPLVQLFVPFVTIRTRSAIIRTLTRLFVTLSGTATRPLCDSIEMRPTTAGSADIGTCHGTSGMARVR